MTFLAAGSFSASPAHIAGDVLPSDYPYEPAGRPTLGGCSPAPVLWSASSLWIFRMKTDDGPGSDHFNGLHFFDPDGAPPKSLREVLRWQFGGKRQRATWPEWAPSPHADTPPERVEGCLLYTSDAADE